MLPEVKFQVLQDLESGLNFTTLAKKYKVHRETIRQMSMTAKKIKTGFPGQLLKGRAKFTLQQRFQIAQELETGQQQSCLAKKYGVSKTTIRYIKLNAERIKNSFTSLSALIAERSVNDK